MSQDAAPVAVLLDVIPCQQRLVLAMSNILKRHVLTVDDLPLSHSFRVKTVLYTVVIVISRIDLSVVPTAIVAVVVRVGVIATTLAGKSTNYFQVVKMKQVTLQITCFILFWHF
jgi:hypothetical protein